MIQKKKAINIFAFFFLITAFVIRMFISNERSTWIEIINLAGLFLAVLNLYSMCYLKTDKFKIVTGIFALILLLMAIGGVLMVADVWKLDARQNDLLTILTLLISLPSDLYVLWIKKAIIRR